MIVLRLIGGLGNQMSQVAYASILAKQNGEQLWIDTSSYKHYKIRPCSIIKYKLNEMIRVKDFKMWDVKYLWMRGFQKIYHVGYYVFGKNKQLGNIVFNRLVGWGHYYSFDSDSYGYPHCNKRDKDVYGYFLAAQNFDGEKEFIKEIFQIKEEYIGKQAVDYLHKIKRATCPVAVSLRLQDDYAQNPVLNVCSIKYFETGLKRILEMNPDATVFVFADDTERAKNIFNYPGSVFIENISDVEGMYLMQQCRHFVISNSSFSWWGAYLGGFSDKVVVAPQRWMNNSKDYSSKYYEGMITVQC